LNLGLRWDGIPHTYEANNRMADFYQNLYNASGVSPNMFVQGSNYNALCGSLSASCSAVAPNLGTSPSAKLAGTTFYLNGIGIAGQNGISNGMVKNYWTDFGPRIGYAYDLRGDHKTVIRGGFGVMYERIQGNDMYNGGPNQPFSTSVSFNNVSLSNPGASLATGNAFVNPITVGSITGLSVNDYKAPASYQFSTGVEQELAKNTVLSVAYVGNLNRHQSDNRQINLPNEGSLSSLQTLGGTTPYNAAVPYLGYNSITLYENAGNSHYNSLQVNLHSQLRKDLTLQVAYTASRAIDPTTGGDLYTLSNPYSRAYDIGPAPLDRTNIGLVNFIYDIPFFRSSQNRAAKAIAGGWTLSGIVTMESGLPIFATLNGSEGSNGVDNGTNRPNFSGTATYHVGGLQYLGTSGFSLPANGQWGNLAKGVLRGPGRDNWNMSMFKSFALNEKGSHIELRVETFNTWNHTEFNGVSTGIGFAGAPGSTTVNNNFGQFTSTWDPRVFQLGGKFVW